MNFGLIFYAYLFSSYFYDTLHVIVQT